MRSTWAKRAWRASRAARRLGEMDGGDGVLMAANIARRGRRPAQPPIERSSEVVPQPGMSWVWGSEDTPSALLSAQIT